MAAKTQQTQKRQAHKALLNLREDLASSSGISSSAQSLADLKISTLVQVSFHNTQQHATRTLSTVCQLSGQVSMLS